MTTQQTSARHQDPAAYANMLIALTEAVLELKRVPAGHMYARVMNHFASVEAFNQAIDTIVRTGLIRREGQEIVWNGPSI
jgi:hypothetical protein